MVISSYAFYVTWLIVILLYLIIFCLRIHWVFPPLSHRDVFAFGCAGWGVETGVCNFGAEQWLVSTWFGVQNITSEKLKNNGTLETLWYNWRTIELYLHTHDITHVHCYCFNNWSVMTEIFSIVLFSFMKIKKIESTWCVLYCSCQWQQKSMHQRGIGIKTLKSFFSARNP